ncbi:hypothetical protein P3W33_17690 [Luteibacter sp. PPL552]
MDGYIQTAIGIFISIVLFLIGYRQTIGARRERTASANRAVYKALLRRLVLEEYSPKLDDVNRLIEGKAQEFKVPSGDLYSDEQLFNQVFAEIFDNDFIAPEKRAEIEKRLIGALDQLSKGKQNVGELRLASPDQERKRFLLLAGLALLASLMGALASLFLLGDKILQFGADGSAFKAPLPVLTVFIASLVSVVAISFVRRAREYPEEISFRNSSATEAALLEYEVAATLAKLNTPFQIEPKIGLMTPDFVADVGGKHIAIEVKSWRTPPPMALISRTAQYMQEVLKSGSADRAVVVTRGRLPAIDKMAGIENVQFIAFKDLEAWLRLQGKRI